MKYTRTAIGLLTAQYRAVLKKCFLINMGLFALGAVATATPANAVDITTQKEFINAVKDTTVSEINFSNDITSGAGIFNRLGTIAQESLTIDGNEHTYNNTSNSGFKLATSGSAQNFTIKNLTMTSYNGITSLITSTENKADVITFDNVTLSSSNNTRFTGFGVIHMNPDSNTFIIKDSSFEDNKAKLSGVFGLFSETSITDSNFTGNTNTTANDANNAGAIFVGAESITSIKGGKFENNTSVGSAGAIGTRSGLSANNSAAKLDIDGVEFVSNTAATFGGAIDNHFYNSVANSGAVSVTNSSFKQNTADKGGAVYNRADLDKAGNAPAIKIIDSDFSDNTATTEGGAVYNASQATIEAKTKDVSFSGNTANSEANDIYNTGTINLTAAAEKTISLEGGIDGDTGVVNVDGAGVVETSTIKNQTVTVFNGELHLSTEATDGSNIAGSTVSVASGATINTIDDVINDYTGKITLADGAVIKGDVNFLAGTADTYAAASGATVKYSVAGLIGDIGGGDQIIQVVSEGATVDINDAVFTTDNGLTFQSSGAADGKMVVKGVAGGINGAVDGTTEEGSKSNVNYTVTADETFDGNSGADNKIENSAFVITGQGKDTSDPKITLAADLVINNDADVSLKDAKFDGAKAIINEGNLTIKDSEIKVAINNRNGATLLSDPTTHYAKIVNDDSTATFDQDTFLNIATTGSNGGALENINNGVLHVIDTDFTNNSTDQKGGAIYSTADFDISSVTKTVVFSGNTANSEANDVYLDNADLAINAKDDTNTITFGGGITGENAEININNDGTSAGTVILGANSVTGGEGVNINLTTGTLSNAGAISGNGTLTVGDGTSAAKVTNTGTISENIVVAANGTLTNNNAVTALGGSNDGTIDGTGDFTLNNATGVFDNNASFTQNSLTITDGEFQTDAGNLHLTTGVTNNGTLTLEGGTLGSAVSGTGSTVIDGAVTSNAAISSATGITINTSTGALTIGAGNVGAAVTNNGDLVLGDGTLAYAVSGNGATEITGAVVNSSTITQATGGILISSGSLTTAAGDVTAAIENNVASGLVFTGGTNANAVSGTGSTVIDGDVTSNASIASSGGITVVAATTADPSAAGKLTIGAGNVGAAVDNDGTLTLGDGTLAYAVSGDGETVIDGAVTSNVAISSAAGITINTSTGALTIGAGNVGAAVTNDGLLKLESGELTKAISGTGETTIKTGATVTNSATITGGDIVVDGELITLADKISDADGILTSGTLTLTGNTLTSAVLDDGGSTDIKGDVTFGANVGTAINVVSDSLTSNANYIGGDVDNDAVVNLTGGTLAKAVSGDGQTVIDGDVTSNASIASSGGITVVAATTADPSAAGKLTIGAGNVGAAVTNDGDLVLQDGTLANNVSGNGATEVIGSVDFADTTTAINQAISITGTGTLTANGANIGGAVTNAADDGLVLIGGTLSQNVGGAGSTKVDTGDVTIASGKVLGQDINIASGSLTAAGESIGGTVDNASTLNITGGTLSQDVTGDGTTNFSGVVTSTGDVEQTLVTVADKLTNSGTITAEVQNNGGILSNDSTIDGNVTNTDGILKNNAGATIKGGTLTNSGASSMITNDGTISSNIANSGIINNTGNGTLAAVTSNTGTITSAATGLVGNIASNGTLNIGAGDMSVDVTGNGTTNIQGAVDLDDANSIANAINIVAGGSLAASANGIDGAVTNAVADGLVLRDGTLAQNVSGAGSTKIAGDVVLNDSNTIGQSISVIGTASLTANANGIGGAVANEGLLDLTGGTLAQDVSGTGVLDVTGAVQNNANIANDIMIESGGSLTTDASKVTDKDDEIDNDGSLVLTGGTLGDSVSGSGSTDITGSVDFANNTTVINQAISIASTGDLTANGANIRGAVANSGLFDLTGGTLAQDVTGTGNTKIKGDVTLNDANSIANAIEIASGSLTANADGIDGAVTNAVADGLVLTGGTLEQNVGGTGATKIAGDVVLNDGNTIGQSISVIGTASLTANANGIGGAVANEGLLDLTGGTLAQDVSGTGVLDVTGAVQNNANIANDIMIESGGSLTTDASKVTDKDGEIDNDGSLVLTGGTLGDSVSGSGSTDITGSVDFANNTTVINQAISIASTGDLTANGANIGGAVANSGLFDLTGGTLAQDVTGTGNTKIEGNVTLNDANSIAQAIEIATGSLTANADGIDGAVTNNALFDLTGGTLAQDVTGTGNTKVEGNVTLDDANSIATAIEIASGSLTANADGIDGAVTNNALFDLTGGTLAQDVTGTGNTKVEGDVTLDDANSIANAIEIASGSLTANADGIDGAVTNDVDDGLVLTGGTLAQDVSGNGTTDITGDVALADGNTIGQDMNVDAAGSLTANADGIGGAVANEGLLDLTGGTLTQDVSGNGTTNITGDVVNEAMIAQSGIYNTGTFTTDAENITAPITNDGTLKLGGSTNANNIDGTGLTEITGTMTLGTSTITGNQVQVNSGASLTLNDSNLDNTVSLKGLNGSTVEIGDNTITVKDASFENGSTVSLDITEATKFGNIKADKISGENGVTLKVSLNPDAELAKIGRPIEYQLFDSSNTTLGEFTLDFDNKDIYKFKQLDTKGLFEVALVKTAEDVVNENGGNANQAAAAKAWIDSERFEDGTPAAEMSDRLADAAQYRPAELLEGLTDVSPSENPIVVHTEINTIRQIYNSVTARLSNGMVRHDGLASGDYMDGISVWAMGLYDKAHLNSHDGYASMRSDTNGVSLGIEKMFNPYLKAGVGYSYTDTDVKTGHRNIDVYTNTAFVYGEYKPSNWFVNGIMSYGWSRYEEKQNAMGMKVKGKYNTETFAAQSTLGREFFTVDGIGITPSVGLRYVHVKQDDHHDSLGSHLSGNQSDTLTGIVGLKLDREFHVNDNWSIKPEVRAAVGYDMVRDPQSVAVTLANGAGYNIKGRALDRLSVEYGAGLTAKLNDTWEMTLSYEGQLRKDYEDNAGMLSLKYNF